MSLIVEQIISADGFVADAEGGIDYFRAGGDWSEMEPEQLEVIAGVGAIVLGANTYRMFSDYWPSADPAVEAVATPINALPKHVISSTLQDAPWGDLEPATIERGDGVESVRRLKAATTGDLMVWGSLTLTEALFAAGEVDRLRLRVIPVLIGTGRTLAPTVTTDTNLTLVASRSFPRGHVTLDYRLA